MHPTNFCRDVIECDRRANLFPIATGTKRSVGSKKWNFAVIGHACRDGRQILLRDSYLNESIGKRFLKMVRLRTFGEIGGEYDNARISLSRFNTPLPKPSRVEPWAGASNIFAASFAVGSSMAKRKYL
jgi:hypothetical protein